MGKPSLSEDEIWQYTLTRSATKSIEENRWMIPENSFQSSGLTKPDDVFFCLYMALNLVTVFFLKG